MPDSLVTASRERPLATFVNVTVTPGSIALLASRMAPETAAESNWAEVIVEHRSVAPAKQRTRNLLMSPPAMWTDERAARGDYGGRLAECKPNNRSEQPFLPEWV